MHPPAVHLPTQALGVALHGELGGRVHGERGRTDEPGDAPHVADVAPSPLEHLGQDPVGEVDEGEHAELIARAEGDAEG